MGNQSAIASGVERARRGMSGIRGPSSGQRTTPRKLIRGANKTATFPRLGKGMRLRSIAQSFNLNQIQYNNNDEPRKKYDLSETEQ
ncbi:hypothetical protein NDU88_002664 [Pleurodeles waltl]|uniref:Uncharacterized protein n=1 Tax=Pleurodeles waltl TaxID=8319 RepID=A0AAV7MNB9_PLEWA|nr:hypothetical protein NDU88_002664 [Pleurodeles waltl]